MEKSILQPIDKFAYIPLYASTALMALTALFLFIASVRKTSKVSFVFFLSLLCVMGGAVFTALHPNLIYFSFMLAAGSLLIMPYAAVKAFSIKDGNEVEDDGKPGAVSGGKRFNVVYEEVDRTLADIQKELLGRATESISAPGAIDSILEYYTKQMIEYTHADGSMALLLDDFDDVLSVKHLEGSFVPPYLLPENIPHKQNRVDMSMKYAQFPLKENIFGEILSGSKAELITEPTKDDRIVQNEKEDFLKCGSYIFIPLIAQSQAIGEIALSRDFGNEPFSDKDFDVAKKLADIMALGVRLITIHNDMIERSNDEKENEISARIQKSLMPAKLPLLPGITNGAFFSSAESICGDFYDLVVARKDRIAFVLGDVTGKNLTSLVIMIQIRAMLRLIINTPQTPATILSWTNRGLFGEADKDHFASISLIFYDSVAKKFTYSSGGTNPIYLFKAAEQVFVKISDDTMPVGMEKETVYTDKTIDCQSGDIIVTCSDGLIEALNLDGKQYSTERLEKIIKENHTLAGKEIAKRVQDDVKNFCGSAVQHDDQTLLCIKIQ